MSLRLAMIAHGVPANQTAFLAERLGITSLADLADLHIINLMRVPDVLRLPLLRLHNANCAGANVWMPSITELEEVDWDYVEHLIAASLVQLANALADE